MDEVKRAIGVEGGEGEEVVEEDEEAEPVVGNSYICLIITT